MCLVNPCKSQFFWFKTTAPFFWFTSFICKARSPWRSAAPAGSRHCFAAEHVPAVAQRGRMSFCFGIIDWCNIGIVRRVYTVPACVQYVISTYILCFSTMYVYHGILLYMIVYVYNYTNHNTSLWKRWNLRENAQTSGPKMHEPGEMPATCCKACQQLINLCLHPIILTETNIQ